MPAEWLFKKITWAAMCGMHWRKEGKEFRDEQQGQGNNSDERLQRQELTMKNCTGSSKNWEE